MRRKIKNLFVLGSRFKKEFRRQARMFITFALGFTIAFTWRQTIFDVSQSFLQYLFHLEHAATLSVLASIFITLISLIIIYIASFYLKDSHENY